MRRLDHIDIKPRARGKSFDELKELILKERNKKICFHKWVYWTYGEATKLHRVCEKCYKKQKNRDVLNSSNTWMKDNPEFPKDLSDIRDEKIDHILT